MLLHPYAFEICVEDARRGVARAQRRLGQVIYGPALKIIADVYTSFLLAMVPDAGPSRVTWMVSRDDCCGGSGNSMGGPRLVEHDRTQTAASDRAGEVHPLLAGQ